MTDEAAFRRPVARIRIPALLAPLVLLMPLAPAAPAFAQPTPADSAAAQPSLPKPFSEKIPSASSVIGDVDNTGLGLPKGKGKGSGEAARVRVGHRHAALPRRRQSRSYAVEPLERPALAGVELVAPLPVPVQPPHFTVPVPAYLPENAATFYTTPLPPVVCRRVPRDPYAPDPHLIRETTVLCEADNP